MVALFPERGERLSCRCWTLPAPNRTAHHMVCGVCIYNTFFPALMWPLFHDFSFNECACHYPAVPFVIYIPFFQEYRCGATTVGEDAGAALNYAVWLRWKKPYRIEMRFWKVLLFFLFLGKSGLGNAFETCFRFGFSGEYESVEDYFRLSAWKCVDESFTWFSAIMKMGFRRVGVSHSISSESSAGGLGGRYWVDGYKIRTDLHKSEPNWILKRFEKGF